MPRNNLKHNLSKTKFYYCWWNMRNRCDRFSTNGYSNYGGRGITYSESWKNFLNFMQDMFPSYEEGLELDRIDNNKGYSKENCRWVTHKINMENTRLTRLFTFKGISDTLTNWAKFLGVNKSLLSQRFYVYNWNVEKTLMKGTIIA